MKFLPISIKDCDALINCFLTTDNVNRLPIKVLVDSGAVTANFVSMRVARWLEEKQRVRSHCAPLVPSNVVNLCGTASSCNTLGLVSCNLIFCNELTNQCETLPCLKFRKLESELDCIIGLPTIRKYRLAQKIPSVFFLVKKRLQTVLVLLHWTIEYKNFRLIRFANQHALHRPLQSALCAEKLE